ncbi:MAG: hypothetical protein Q4C52_06785 [Eubacteriales bacterium]|nr:hypothetical protein [Eubacteriales bacterium]
MSALICEKDSRGSKTAAMVETVSMCAQPLGNALYGVLFEICKGFEYAVVLFSGIVSFMIALSTRTIFSRFSADTKNGGAPIPSE